MAAMTEAPLTQSTLGETRRALQELPKDATNRRPEVVDLTKEKANSKPYNQIRATFAPSSRPAPAAFSSSSSKKRKAGTEQPDLSTIEVDGMYMDMSPNQVRGKIRRLIESGELGVGQFCDTIGVSQTSYRRFMGQSGNNHGNQSDCYSNAWAYLKKRQIAGMKISNKKAKTGDASSSTAPGPGSGSSASGSGSDAMTAKDLADIHVPGEETDTVEIYDSCDEIRRKRAAHLRKPGVTRAQFCRDLVEMYKTSERRPNQIQGTQVTTFQSRSGADVGNTSCVFYAAYVFFEKMRLKEKKPKSKHREGMEQAWGKEEGMITDRRQDHVFAHVSQTVTKDKFGQWQIY